VDNISLVEDLVTSDEVERVVVLKHSELSVIKRKKSETSASRCVEAVCIRTLSQNRLDTNRDWSIFRGVFISPIRVVFNVVRHSGGGIEYECVGVRFPNDFFGVIVSIFIVRIGIVVILANEVNGVVGVSRMPVRCKPCLSAGSINWCKLGVDLGVPVKNESRVEDLDKSDGESGTEFDLRVEQCDIVVSGPVLNKVVFACSVGKGIVELDEGISSVGLWRILEVQRSVYSLINNGVVEYTHAIRLDDDVTCPVEDLVTSLEGNGVVVLNLSKSRVRVVKVS
jgi:hypothetical protein